jgi:hypothetical protein
LLLKVHVLPDRHRSPLVIGAWLQGHSGRTTDAIL